MGSGKYRLGEHLGGGGMAEVFRATLIGAEGFARPVAIKRVLPGYSADQMFADMLKTEAKIASLLTHPNIVSVLDFDRDEEDRLFLVMELVEGKDLYQLLQSGRVSSSIATFVIAELLRALAFAHAMEHRGQPMFIVHRDVSPHNVMIAWSGAVKLGDFGIAKAAATTQVTKTGVVKGKVAYLSPEQALAKDLDGRSDLFAVGIVLHELLTGARLFGVKSGAQEAVIVHRVLNLPIESPRTANASISPALEGVCLKLLARDRDERFQTADAALEALLACPEMSVRGELEMAELLLTRFPKEAPPPGSWQSFAARTKTAAPAAKKEPSLEYGGFSAVEEHVAPRKGGTAPLTGAGRKEVPSGETQLLVSAPGRAPSNTALISGGSFPHPREHDWKTLSMYAVLGACAVVIAILGWRVWLLYFGTAGPSDSAIIAPRPADFEVQTATRSEDRGHRYPVLYPPAVETPEPAETKSATKTRPTKSKQRARPDAAVSPDTDRVLKPDL